MSKAQEIREEFNIVFMGGGVRVTGAVLPLLIFILSNPFLGVNIALGGSLAIALIFAVVQLIRREKVIYVLGGIGGVLIAWLFVRLSGSETGFFLPGLISGAVMVGLSILSITINRPLVAWSSFITRRWRLDWYWHPKVLPAYSEATMIWAGAFFMRIALEYWVFLQGDINVMGTIRLFLGWPYTILLLAGSYIYGQWRLAQLGGPSVEEFISGSEPPWEGQQRGF